jgi:hypothetical protein
MGFWTHRQKTWRSWATPWRTVLVGYVTLVKEAKTPTDFNETLRFMKRTLCALFRHIPLFQISILKKKKQRKQANITFLSVLPFRPQNKLTSFVWTLHHCKPLQPHTCWFPTIGNNNMADARIVREKVTLAPLIIGSWQDVS